MQVSALCVTQVLAAVAVGEGESPAVGAELGNGVDTGAVVGAMVGTDGAIVDESEPCLQWGAGHQLFFPELMHHTS